MKMHGALVKIFLGVVVIAACGALAYWAWGTHSPGDSGVYEVSFPIVSLESGEKIIGFEISVNSASIQAVANVPSGWNVVIDNEPSWISKINGDMILGSYSVSSERLSNFKFHVIKNDENYIKFSISGTVIVTNDFYNFRYVSINQKQFSISSGNARDMAMSFVH